MLFLQLEEYLPYLAYALQKKSRISQAELMGCPPVTYYLTVANKRLIGSKYELDVVINLLEQVVKVTWSSEPVHEVSSEKVVEDHSQTAES